MSIKAPSLRALALQLARDRDIPLADAQAIVFVAAQRAAKPDVQAPAPQYRPPAPATAAPPATAPAAARMGDTDIARINVRSLSLKIMEQHPHIDIARAQQIATEVVNRARASVARRGQ